MDGAVQSGVIHKLKSDRGFGFVRGVGGRNLFFHLRDCADGVRFDELTEGQAVTFIETQSEKGPRAIHVQPA